MQTTSTSSGPDGFTQQPTVPGHCFSHRLPEAPRENVDAVASLCGLLGQPTLVRIMCLLGRGERNVTELCTILRQPQPTVSHHLGLLRRGGLLTSRREGKSIHYGLDGKLEFSEGCELSIRSTAGVKIRIIR